jgi:RNA polymerase sigma-70 factor, ECF subfamily
MATPLAPVFIAHAGPVADAELDRLESLLQRITSDAWATWSDVTVPSEAFLRYLGERAAQAPAGVRVRGLLDTLEALQTSDLYLACACAVQDARAMELFDAHFIARVDHVLLRLAMPAWAVDETKQVLRCRFFLARGDERGASIEDYSGRGTLKAWVSAAAVHTAYRVLQTPKRQTDTDSVVIKAVAAPGDDLELEYLKRRYTREFEDALAETFASLTARERNILRCYHLESGGIDGVAALYRVHRVTASRWVKRITEDFLERTRLRLVERTHANRAEVSSLLRLIQSRLDAIVRSVLAASTDGGR